MLNVLTGNILPVFSVLALGFILGRGRVVSESEARAANRLAFLIFQPALIFPLVAQFDVSTFPAKALALYVVAEILCFTLTYLIARRVFGREHGESWLLAMAVVFVNTLLYVWPISVLIYGTAGAAPITAIVAWDSTVSFAFFIISMELISGKDGTTAAVRSMGRNPVLVAIVLGIAMNLAGLAIPAPVETALHYAGAAASPLTLLAVGIILSGSRLTPSPVVVTVSAFKLALFPAIVWALIAFVDPGDTAAPLFLLTAAGPSGMMAFALALLYGVRTDAITPVIIWTSFLSLIPLALLA